MPRAVPTSGETITVACKLPHGLTLRVFEMVDTQEAVAGGGFRIQKRAQAIDGTVFIRGYLTDMKASPVLLPSIKSRFALTEGVNKEFFVEWLKQNADHEAVKNRLIFAHDTDTKGMTREFVDVQTKVDPIDPAKLKSNPHPNVSVGGYEKDKALG